VNKNREGCSAMLFAFLYFSFKHA